MRLLILGANGKKGSQLVDLALARDHEVTAFVRSPAKVTRRHPLLKVIPGDPYSADALADALPRHDVVLSAVGVRPPLAFRSHAVLQDCAASTVAAMTRAREGRLSAGLGRGPGKECPSENQCGPAPRHRISRVRSACWMPFCAQPLTATARHSRTCSPRTRS